MGKGTVVKNGRLIKFVANLNPPPITPTDGGGFKNETPPSGDTTTVAENIDISTIEVSPLDEVSPVTVEKKLGGDVLQNTVQHSTNVVVSPDSLEQFVVTKIVVELEEELTQETAATVEVSSTDSPSHIDELVTTVVEEESLGAVTQPLAITEVRQLTLEEEAGILAVLLADEAVCPNKEELAIFRQKFSPEVLQAACKQLSPERHAQIMQWVIELNAKAQHQPVKPVQKIVVGSVVLWPNCPGHWESWSPFIVQIIHPDGMVKLDIARPDYLVDISELRLAKE